LIERVIRSAVEAGANDFYVITGYQSEHVCAFLGRLAGRLGFPITTILNDAWKEGNGLSVLKAREYLHEPFLLLMADHLFDPSIARTLMRLPLKDGEIILGVDGNTRNPLVDVDDVTRVETEGKKVLHIAKGLAPHNGFDTGIFMCTPRFFDTLERSVKESGDTTLSGAVRALSDDGLVRVFDIDNRFWIDVDDPAIFRKAEKALLDSLRDKANDGPVSRYLNRPISAMLSRRLVKSNVTPNQISLFSFLCSVLAAGMFALGGYPTLLLGGILAQFASIIDGSDGEVARLKYQSSDYGGWFDAVLDRYADAFLLLGLTWHLLAAGGSGLVLFAGFMAIVGSFMLSYTADKYDKLMRERIVAGGRAWVRMGRDVRVFIIFLGAVTNLVLPVLVTVAVVMNLETLRRVMVLRRG
jgi:CDP-L-myo-inositol myo-inositolphosphotransferase